MSVAVALDFQFRLYDPNIGRFLSVDPHPGFLNQPTTVINQYIYVGNNSQNWTDPRGRIAPILIAMAVGAAINVSALVLSGHTITLSSVAQAAAVGAIAGGVGFGVGALAGGGFAGAAIGGFAGGASGSFSNSYFSGENPFSEKNIIKAVISGGFGAASGLIGQGIYAKFSSWNGSSTAAEISSEYSAGFGASSGEAVVDPLLDKVLVAPLH